MEIEEALERFSFNDAPVAHRNAWDPETTKKAFALYERFRDKKKYLESIAPNRKSSIVSCNPLMQTLYFDSRCARGSSSPSSPNSEFFEADPNENYCENDYVNKFNTYWYIRTFCTTKPYVEKYANTISLDARSKEMTMYQDLPSSTKTSRERFYDYILNLLTVPMLVPMSPFLALVTREDMSKLYSSSSETLCTLAKLYAIRTISCPATVKNGNQFKSVTEHALLRFQEEDAAYFEELNPLIEEYEICIRSCTKAFFEGGGDLPSRGTVRTRGGIEYVVNTLEDAYYENDFLDETSSSSVRKACDAALENSIRRIWCRVSEVMYSHFIRLLNIAECRCINLYVHSGKADEELNHMADVDNSTRKVCEDWIHLTTHNCLNPSPVPEGASVGYKRRQAFFEGARAYMMGRSGMREWNEMHHVQMQYVNNQIKEHMKLPGFREEFDECLETHLYRYLEKVFSEYQTSYEEKVKGTIRDATRLDCLCISSYACLKMMTVFVARNKRAAKIDEKQPKEQSK